MKCQNWKLCSLMRHIDLWLPFLCLVGMVVLLLFIFDSTFPVFKYSLLCANIITLTILIALTIVLIVVIINWRKKLLNNISNYSKILYSSLCLISSFVILSSIEYLVYINNQKNFYLEKDYIQTSINDKIFDIKREIKSCEKYINEYLHIFEELKNKEHIEYSNANDLYFTVINDDTIEIKIYGKVPLPGTGTNGIYTKLSLNNAESIGISLNNESRHISHPTSKVILKSMQQNDSISGNDFRLLVHQKIKSYQDRIKEYEAILEDELVVTFGDFVIYSIFNSSITGNKTHILIRLLFLFQTIVITFFSGYIYQTLYKILDGKDKKSPEV